jgi:hypothetical protein
MNYYKKQQLKEKFRRNKAIIIGTSAFALAGLTVMIVGFVVGGWDIIGWLTGPLGISFYIMMFFFACGVGIIFYIFFIKKDKEM